MISVVFFLDYNECRNFPDYCPVHAYCVNNYGSYSCACPVGYRLSGDVCEGLFARSCFGHQLNKRWAVYIFVDALFLGEEITVDFKK